MPGKPDAGSVLRLRRRASSEIQNVERIRLRQVGAAALGNACEHGFALLLADAFARKQALQHRMDEPP